MEQYNHHLLHTPDELGQAKCAHIREAAIKFDQLIDGLCPESEDKALAKILLRFVRMSAISSIVQPYPAQPLRQEVPAEDPQPEEPVNETNPVLAEKRGVEPSPEEGTPRKRKAAAAEDSQSGETSAPTADAETATEPGGTETSPAVDASEQDANPAATDSQDATDTTDTEETVDDVNPVLAGDDDAFDFTKGVEE